MLDLIIAAAESPATEPADPISIFGVDLVVESLLVIAALGVVAFVVGRLTRGWLSEVIVFIAIGILIGPEVAGIVDAEGLAALDPVLALALGAIVFGIGERLELPALKNVRHTLAPIAILENLLTFGLVFFAILQFTELGAGAAYLLAAIALSTSPTTLVAVISSKRAKGQLTDHIMATTALNNVTSALFFGLGLPFVVASGDQGGFAAGAIAFGQLLLLSTAIGAVAAFILRRYHASIHHSGERLLFVLVVLIGVVAVSRELEAPVVISTLVAGALTANDKRDMTPIFRTLKTLDEPIFLVFFIVAGAGVHLKELREIGILGVYYVAARLIGKMVGGYAGAQMTRGGRRQGWTVEVGYGLMPFAGMAIGLAAFTVEKLGEAGQLALGQNISSIVLGSVVVFELLGPVTVGRALDSAGESGAATAEGEGDDDAARFAPHQIHHILFPVSNVEMARQKAPTVADLALSMGATLTALHIIPEGSDPDPDIADPALSVVKQQAALRNVKFEPVVRSHGNVVDAIIEEAERAAVDLIVMGEPQPRSLLDRGARKFIHDVIEGAPREVRVMVIPTALDRRGHAIALPGDLPAVAAANGTEARNEGGEASVDDGGSGGGSPEGPVAEDATTG